MKRYRKYPTTRINHDENKLNDPFLIRLRCTGTNELNEESLTKEGTGLFVSLTYYVSSYFLRADS